MLPTFFAAENPSRKPKKDHSKPRDFQKMKRIGKENMPIHGNVSTSTKIPTLKNLPSVSTEKKSNLTSSKALKSEKIEIGEKKEEKTKAVPDFEKIHRQWSQKFEKRKEATKKAPTKTNAFNLNNRPSNRSEKIPKDDDEFKIDAAAFQSILDGNLSMVLGKEERKTIGVPNRSHKMLQELQANRGSFHATSLRKQVPPRLNSRDLPEDKASTRTSLYAKKPPRMGVAEKANRNQEKEPVTRRGIIEATKQRANAPELTGFVQDFKIDFKPDPSSLQSILHKSGVDKTPTRGSSTFGPMKRMTFNGISRKKPYSISNNQERKGSIYHNENYEKFKKLTFEQRLSVIINARPGLNGTRGTANVFKDAPARNSFCVLKQQCGGEERNALGDSAAKVLNQNDGSKAAKTPPPVDTGKNSKDGMAMQAGKPKSKPPRQLCEINYISPRKDHTTPNSRKSSSKSHPNPFKSPNRQQGHTPIKDFISKLTPRKLGSTFKLAPPMRMTAEARWNLKHGLPLPPKERRYEAVDPSKPATTTPKHTSGLKDQNELGSSVANKKSVRWADVLERRKSEATKQLNFEDEVVHGDNTPKQQEIVESRHCDAGQRKETLISKIFRNLQNLPGDVPVRSPVAETRLIHSNTQPKVNHIHDNTNEVKNIPKPFVDHSFALTQARKSTESMGDWGVETPGSHQQTATPGDLNSSHVMPLQTPSTKHGPATNNDLPVLRGSNQRTPLAGHSFDSSFAHGPFVRRSFARTPYAKEEEDRRKRENSSLDQTFLSSACVQDPRTEASPANTTIVPNENKGLEFSGSGNGVQWRSAFDVSNGVLQVIDGINKWSITEDIKRIRAYRENQIKSWTVLTVNSAGKSKICGSDCSVYDPREKDDTKRRFDYSSDAGLSKRQHRAASPSAVKFVPNIPPHSKSLGGNDSLIKYLTALPEPLGTKRSKHVDLSPHKSTDLTNGKIIYSTAPIRASPSFSAINVTANVPFVFSKGQKIQTTGQQMTGFPSFNIKQGTVQNNTSDSVGFSELERSHSHHNPHTHEKEVAVVSKISGIVEEHLRPVRSMISNVITNRTSPRHDSDPLTQETPSNRFIPITNLDSESKIHSEISPTNQLGRKTSGNEQGFQPFAGSAFRKISTGSNVSTRSQLSERAQGEALLAQRSNVSEYCNPKLLDTEVAFYTKYLEVAQRLGSRRIETRDCHDPVAKILMLGDAYHFIPIED